MAYTNVAKPTSSTYTRITTEGIRIHNDVNVDYDDSSTLFDSIDISQYTNVAKPTSSVYTNISKPT